MRNAWQFVSTGVVGAALVVASATASFAAPSTAKGVTAWDPSHAVITAKADRASVKAWRQFRISGNTSGLDNGSKVTVQQKQRGRWVSLPISTKVTWKKPSYSLRVKLGIKGKNSLRVVGNGVASRVMTVGVR
ncbi:hypothetical protein Stsp01_65070 [Streptomyces sp. NBRC 13847]|uniref:hypothetical protein n=1 Tax=Streptomyces TaxID=1883 RepID=UPI0024A12907|nr:hypothetical protein [Streptomyces sp. NBRC 13847]GLW19764.1 hypothetical protein Stsp01_65070 [Streptomyces sp. NBRC 13847]